MNTRVLFGLLAPACFVAACATTNMTSMLSPEAKGKTYTRILVVADLQDLGLIQAAEIAIQRMAAEKVAAATVVNCDSAGACFAPGALAPGTEFIPAHTLLFPGRDFTPEELARILSENRIQATLVLSPTASGVSESYVPPTYVTQCATWRSTTSCSSNAVGGGTISRPWVSFAARMYDARSGATVWIATSSTNGSAMSGSATLIQSMAAKTLANLIADQVVR